MVRHVTLTLRSQKPGEVVALMGGSGAGKSTLLNCIAERLDPGLVVSGSILVNGLNISDDFKRSSAYVLQDDLMYPFLTVKETVSYSSRFRLPSSVSDEGCVFLSLSVFLMFFGQNEASAWSRF